MKRAFTIAAIWDDEAKVFYSESDIEGLHIEADTLEEFESFFRDIAIELIMQNHISEYEVSTKNIRDLVPSIFWQRPDTANCYA